MRAERRAGQLSAQLTTARGKRSTDGPNAKLKGRPTKIEQLREAGISEGQAKKWEKLAAVSDDQFEVALAGAKRPSTKGIIAATTAPKKQNRVSTQALQLHRRLLAFDRDMLTAEPADILRTMTPQMANTVIRLAPRVAAWLQRIGVPAGRSDDNLKPRSHSR